MWELDYKEGWGRRIDTFELWCWIKLLRFPWTARRSNWSILKEISLTIHWKDWCWSWNSSILATWYEGLTHWNRPWCWEKLKAEGEGDNRGWDGWMTSPTQCTWVWVNSGSWWWTGRLACCDSWGRRVGHGWAAELNWTESAIPSNHLILCYPFLLLPLIFSSIKVCSNKSALRIKVSKYWSFSNSPSNEDSGLISFRID